MTAIGEEWVTFSEATDMFSIGMTAELVRELSLSTRAMLISEEVFDVGHHGDRNVDEILQNALERGQVPLRLIPGGDYYYQQVVAIVPYVHGYEACAFPVSHVLRAALEPWLAERSAMLLAPDYVKRDEHLRGRLWPKF